MTKMQRLASALLLLACAAPAAAADQVAPAVTRKPAAPAPDAQIPEDPAAASQVPVAASSPAVPGKTSQQYLTALQAAAGSGEDQVLDQGLMKAMSHLLAAGRCSEASAMASRSGRAPLATRAQQLCRGK